MENKSIVDLLKSSNKKTFSFEVTPDVSEELIDRVPMEPLFYSITWHAKSHQCKDLEIPPLKLAKYLKSKQKNVLLHLSCDMMQKDYLDQLLIFLQQNNISNLFVILGEKYDPAASDFKHSKHLITYIREKTGNYFCIGVAGFPGKAEELAQLKEKIDAGANFVITQAFFEAQVFNNYLLASNQIGINVPIIPGIFLFETYQQLEGFVRLCKVDISNDLLEQVRNGDTQPLKDIAKALIDGDAKSKHFHLFTMNKLDDVMKFIEL